MKKQLNDDQIILKRMGMVDDFINILLANGYGVIIVPEGEEYVGITIIYPNIEVD